jgi:hypothetical protein
MDDGFGGWNIRHFLPTRELMLTTEFFGNIGNERAE